MRIGGLLRPRQAGTIRGVSSSAWHMQTSRRRNFGQVRQSAEDANSGGELIEEQSRRDEFREAATARDGSPRYESDNMWDYKPAWCQPWTILSTGTGFVSLVYQVSGHSKLVTGIASLPVAAWWVVFLVLVPASFKEYVQTQNVRQ